MLKWFQTPTHPVIISNLSWCFFVENSVETSKDVAKVEHLWKKREKQFWKTCYTAKSLVFAKGKKTSSFFIKDLCQIYFVQKTKRTFLKTSCWKSKCWLVWFTREKEKQGLYLQSFDLNVGCLIHNAHSKKKFWTFYLILSLLTTFSKNLKQRFQIVEFLPLCERRKILCAKFLENRQKLIPFTFHHLSKKI